MKAIAAPQIFLIGVLLAGTASATHYRIEVTLDAEDGQLYTYTVPAEQFSVVTLKHVQGGANFDFAVAPAKGDELLTQCDNPGTTTELALVEPAESPQPIQILVLNGGNEPSTYRLTVHDIDPAVLVARAAVETGIEEIALSLFGANESAEGRQLNRAMTAGWSMLQERNLAQTSKAVMLAEIENFVANDLGTGVIGRVTFKALTGFVEEVYWYY